MERRTPAELFPRVIQSPRLGALTLDEVTVEGRLTSRNYKPADRIEVASGWVRLDPKGLELVIWPPRDGVPDVAHFVATVEARLKTFEREMDRILYDSIPAIDETLNFFWQIEGEPAPAAKAILDSGLLRLLCLNAGSGSHQFIVYDYGDLVGSHDIVVELAEDFQVESAGFDG